MKTILISLRSLLLFTLLLGGVYPLLILILGSMLSPIRSHGSLLKVNEKIVGSELIGQKFVADRYFSPRPSVANYNPLAAAASQRSATDKTLMEEYQKRERQLEKAPQDLLWASASGLDPHISVEAAHFQKPRIMAVRSLTEDKVNDLIEKATEDRFLGFMGRPRVNVLELNLLLDR